MALKHRRLSGYHPYTKQREFHDAGLTHRERVLLAGNQLGKTLCAGNETAYHLTGDYPDWWMGRRFIRPPKLWAANTNNETVRAGPQTILLGEAGNWGTGTVPRTSLAKKPTMARGMSDLVDTFQVRHKSGGISTCQFKAYEQGRKPWQTSTLDGIWFDEEPPVEIYGEGLARIAATGGITYMTMTPLLGMSEVVMMFFPEPSTIQRHLTQMSIEDALHLDAEERQIVIEGYRPHEREARSRGLPMLGEGTVFPVPQESIECEAFAIPTYWKRGRGIDFGYGDHPTAAADCVFDPDKRILYLVGCYKEKEMVPAVHIASVRAWEGDNGMSYSDGVPWFWPHDGSKSWGDSGPIAGVYRKGGLNMWREHSTFREGGFSPEAAAGMLLSWMQSGRFKAFTHLQPWWTEFSTYHRKDGKLVQKNDDIISALFKVVMMLRYMRPPDSGRHTADQGLVSEWNPFEPSAE